MGEKDICVINSVVALGNLKAEVRRNTCETLLGLT